MAENPFEDDGAKSRAPLGKRRYLVLISASRDNAALAQTLLRNLQTFVDKGASPLWIDAKGIGVFVATTLAAVDIRREAFQSSRPDELADVRDLLILEIGDDWYARREAKTEHWLSSHVGPPQAGVGAVVQKGKRN